MPTSHNKAIKPKNTTSRKKKALYIALSLVVLGLAYAVATNDYDTLVKCGRAKGAGIATGVLKLLTGLLLTLTGLLQLTIGTLIVLVVLAASLGLNVIVYTVEIIFGSFVDLSSLLDMVEDTVQFVSSLGSPDKLLKSLFAIPLTHLVDLTQLTEAIAKAGC